MRGSPWSINDGAIVQANERFDLRAVITDQRISTCNLFCLLQAVQRNEGQRCLQNSQRIISKHASYRSWRAFLMRKFW